MHSSTLLSDAFSGSAVPSAWDRSVSRAPFLKGTLVEFVESMEAIESGSGGEWGPVWPMPNPG